MTQKKRGNAPPQNIPNQLKHGNFWAGFTAFFLLSVLVIISAVDGTLNITGNVAVEPIGYGPAGSDLTFEVRNVPGMKDATVYFKETVKQGTITFTETEFANFDGSYVVAFTVSSLDENKIEKIDLRLKLKEKDILEKGIAVNDLTVYRDGSALTTTTTKKQGGYVYYTATTGALGTFVVGKASTQDVPTVQETPDVIVPMKDVVPEAPQQQEEPAVQQETADESEAVAGKAVEQESSEQTGAWSKFIGFWEGLFS